MVDFGGKVNGRGSVARRAAGSVVIGLGLAGLACSTTSDADNDGNGSSGDEEACSSLDAAGMSTAAAAPPTELVLPPARGVFDYQLGCAYPVPAGANVVMRDRTAPADANAYAICYVNGFQTQPGSDWSGPLDDLILRDSRGDEMIDPEWPDEYFLDISTPERRTRLVAVVAPWIEGCAESGFDAVEFDNLDSYARSGGLLTVEHAEAYAAELIRVAHASLLAVGQKNASERSAQFRALGFDFSISEQCWEYDECDQYTAVYGERVFDVEYAASAFERGCDAGRAPSPILRDLELVSPGPGYVRRECP
ncbi:MAG TPA: endo alpha-1,4 polygalactosaminidase [Polyangiaceae bacterium]|nr:endo alpha-1,4 polygalactosaminidase [Polyangiaceae bacterium]